MLYECNPGYKLENPNTKSRRCHSNGKFTGYQPKCIEATCDSPPDIPNAILQTTVHESGWFGKVTLLRMTTGFKVTYGCRDGHRMVPKGEDPPGLTCTGTGQWSEPNFDCQSSQCGAPPEINDGYLSVFDHSEFYHVGYRAHVQCNRGFIKKKEEVTCLPNGEWDVEEPMCQRTLEDPLCGLPPPINNGYLWVRDQSRFYPVGYRAGVQCHPGFIQRKKQVTCQPDGKWDVEEVMCQGRFEDYSVCGKGFDSSTVVNDLSNNNISDADHSTSQRTPWTVQLFAIEGAKSYTPTCLGSLIDKEWVLTSGLCFPKNTDPRRILTKTGIDKYHLSIAERIVNIENRAEDNKMWTASAALIKLKKPVTFSQFVHPVCLPHAQEGFAKPHGPPKTGYSSSWSKGILNDRHGDIEKMHMAIQTVVNCRNSLNKAFVGERELDPNIFCAVDNAGSLDVCGRDLGSPLYQYVVTSENQGQWVQMGIASAFKNQVDGEMRCLNPSRFYDLFLDVSRIVSSIRNIIKSS